MKKGSNHKNLIEDMALIAVGKIKFTQLIRQLKKKKAIRDIMHTLLGGKKISVSGVIISSLEGEVFAKETLPTLSTE